MSTDDVSGLTKLGSQGTGYSYAAPDASMLETFPNNFPGRAYIIRHSFQEFTSLCPKTGQPDFAEIEVEYVADQKCVESKSLKLYYFAFRSYGSFMETITNKILADLVRVCSPVWMRVTASFAPRGGIRTVVTAEHGNEAP